MRKNIKILPCLVVLLIPLLFINARAYESTFSVTIPKDIVMDGSTKSATYSVDVKGNIKSGESAVVSVTPSNSFTLSNIVANGYPSKEAISAQVSQNATSWTYNDIMKGITTNGNIVANDISAGDWSGSLNFNVKFDVSTMVINVTNGEAIYDGNATNGNAKVEVTYPTSGYTIKYGTTNGTYDLDEMPTYTNPGTYEVYYKIEASNYTTKTGSLTITINEGLNGYTWEEVSAICAKGEAKNYFSVGDEAVINLGEMDSMTYGYYGTLDTTTTLEKQTAIIVVGDVTNTSLTLLFTSYSTQAPSYQMNPSTTDSETDYGTTDGGWEATILRTWLNSKNEGGFYNALSSSLKKAITTHISSYSSIYNASEVSYCGDKLWLLSSKEIYGGDTATSVGKETSYENLVAFNTETQLAYFTNGGSKLMYSNNNTCVYWLRSTSPSFIDRFNFVFASGDVGTTHSSNAWSVFPAFTIGQPSLNDYSWSEIQGICKLGLANEYFNVGDTKTIDIDALPSASNTPDAQEATLAIGDISSDGTTMTMLVTSYSTLAPTHVMNTTATNVGGWEATTMRTWLNDEYLSALSSDLQNIIITHKTSYSKTYDASDVSYCNDKVWLLSSKEVFGGGTATSAGSATSYENLAAFNAETQLAYFANIATTSSSRVRYINNQTTTSTIANWWWLRSSYFYDNCWYNYICENGTISDGNANYYFYVFPAFDIGYKENVGIEKKDSFSDYTWSEVQAICQQGLANEYFSVGDTKTISLGSMNVISYSDDTTVLTLDAQTATMVVGDISSDGKTLTMLFTSYSTLAPTYYMNTSGTNVGGWASTAMRTWLNNSSSGGFYAALPSDLQSAIKTHSTSYSATYDATSVNYCDDKVWLLSSKEVFGGGTATSAGSATSYENLAAFNIETQLAYFANGNSKIRYKSGTSACVWWLRSSYYSNSGHFTNVSSDGSSNNNYADDSYYVFPAFCIG